MDREQHITQDAAEHYAVYLMARNAEEKGVAARQHSDELYKTFTGYLADREWTMIDFDKYYPQYKRNADQQIPAFVTRLIETFPNSMFEFEINEASYRNLGLKADFRLQVYGAGQEYFVSLKNYIGTGGIDRPQVSSGTFLSFAAGFVFDRAGVGQYVDPRNLNASFQGSNQYQRDAVLDSQGRPQLKEPLQGLVDLNAQMRDELLKLEFYDAQIVKDVIADIVPKAQVLILRIFAILGHEVVRQKFLERAGLDGTEDALYFDAKNILDTITNNRFADLRAELNDPATEFAVQPVGQSLRFAFTADDRTILHVDVPLTINTNGAWHRPKIRYSGTQRKSDKGHPVDLQWGQIRPYKSRELATSTNTYINLRATGIFLDNEA